MARYKDEQCRRCRREGQKLFLKGERCYSDKCSISRRNYAPGQHGQKRAKLSEYGTQLREKQKTKNFFSTPVPRNLPICSQPRTLKVERQGTWGKRTEGFSHSFHRVIHIPQRPCRRGNLCGFHIRSGSESRPRLPCAKGAVSEAD